MRLPPMNFKPKRKNSWVWRLSHAAYIQLNHHPDAKNGAESWTVWMRYEGVAPAYGPFSAFHTRAEAERCAIGLAADYFLGV